jgi:uncharacterized delta-60 repeat protein
MIAIAALLAATLLAPADLDQGFGRNGRQTLDPSDLVRALALQPDGRILVGGDAPTGGMPDHEGVVYRLDPSGTHDPTFAPPHLTLEAGAAALGLQPDGRILAAGSSQGNAAVYRLTAQGIPDATFDDDGLVVIDSGDHENLLALALQPNGKILVAGGLFSVADGGDPVVYRLNRDGSLDSDFGDAGRARIEGSADGKAVALAVQADGKILVAGVSVSSGDGDAVVHRLNANGTLDRGFGENGTFVADEGNGEFAYALALQADGRSLLVGASTRLNNTATTFVYRLRTDGTPDPSFGSAGRIVIDDGPVTAGMAAALQPDGKLLVTGFAFDDPDYDVVAYRLNPDGSRDGGFGADGGLRIAGANAEAATAVAVQHDGKVILGGVASSGITRRALLYRLQGGEPIAPSPVTPAAPVLGRLRITPSAFRVARPASVSFTLDRAASVRFAVTRCARVAKRRCVRYRLLRGGFTRQGTPGGNRFRLSGRINGRRLRAARYRLIATPVADGLRGDPKRTRFRVKPRRTRRSR